MICTQIFEWPAEVAECAVLAVCKDRRIRRCARLEACPADLPGQLVAPKSDEAEAKQRWEYSEMEAMKIIILGNIQALKERR